MSEIRPRKHCNIIAVMNLVSLAEAVAGGGDQALKRRAVLALEEYDEVMDREGRYDGEVEKFRRMAESDDLEVDPSPMISDSEYGIFINTWVWASTED